VGELGAAPKPAIKAAPIVVARHAGGDARVRQARARAALAARRRRGFAGLGDDAPPTIYNGGITTVDIANADAGNPTVYGGQIAVNPPPAASSDISAGLVDISKSLFSASAQVGTAVAPSLIARAAGIQQPLQRSASVATPVVSSGPSLTTIALIGGAVLVGLVVVSALKK
jgi:hypothetical protein